MKKNDGAEDIVREMVKQLKTLRHARSLSHNALAKKAGITRVAVSHIESGRRNPSLKVAIRLAHALDVTLSDLLRPMETSGTMVIKASPALKKREKADSSAPP